MNYLQLSAVSPLPDLTGLHPFKAILVAEQTLSPERRAAVCRWLLDSGCLYLMAWGPECSGWKSAIDEANAAAWPPDEIPDKRLIISTSHENEALEDVFWFAKNTAMHPCFELNNVLLLHLADAGKEQQLIGSYVAA